MLVPTPGNTAVPAIAPATAALFGNTTGLLTVPETSSGTPAKPMPAFTSTTTSPSKVLFGFTFT